MDASFLKDLIDYDPDTGAMIWKARAVGMFSGGNPVAAMRAWNARFAGTPALNAPNGRGYLTGCVFGTRIAAHRAAWAIVHGSMPDSQIDHINGRRDDNRLCNLRLATVPQNQYNAAAKSVALRTAKRGAHWHARNQKWSASIRVHLGYFDTEAEAAAAYEAAAKNLHGRFYLARGERVPSTSA